jgi:signal peptidase II
MTTLELEDIPSRASRRRSRRLRPLLLSVFLILLDQSVKAVIVRTIPMYTVGASLWGGFLRIIHTRNLAIAFSIGRSLPEQARFVIFIILPLVLLVALVFYFVRTDGFSDLQRWALAAIIGGGFGNMVDRLFRPEGVVDFIDVRFYGLFGLERWPTFNIADSSVVIGGILLAVSFIIEKEGKNE